MIKVEKGQDPYSVIGQYIRDTGFGVIPDDNVLAWMPLPERYQEGEDNEKEKAD